MAGRFFQLFLILTEQIPLSCFYNGKCSVKGSDYNNTSNCNTAEIAGDVVKVEILSLIVTSFFCVSGGPSKTWKLPLFYVTN